MQAERGDDLEFTTRSRGDRRVVAVGAAIEAVEAQRREVLGVDVGVGLEVALDVPGVDPEQDDGHDPLEPDRLERQERGADGERVGDRRSSGCRGRGRACRRASTSPVGRRRATVRTATPVTNIASVASMNGAPRIAPTPTACDASPAANRIAMIGIIVSGSAVPTAASTEPTAPSARSSLRPNHSMPFVNSSAPSRMIDERDDEDEEVHGRSALQVMASATRRRWR